MNEIGKLLAIGGALVGGIYAIKRGLDWWSLDQSLRERLRFAAEHARVSTPALVIDTSVELAASDGVVVLYNPAAFERHLSEHCATEYCRVAFETGVMAHELAHHIHMDAQSRTQRLIWDDSSHRQLAQEQRADMFAGEVLARAGVEPCVATRVFSALAPSCSTSHGCGSDRARAILIGYERMWSQR